MKALSKNKDQNSSNLIKRFHEDCNLRGMAYTMDYIYRVKEFCAFLEAQGKNPLNVSRDDLKAFLGHLKKRDLKGQDDKPIVFMSERILRILDSGRVG